MSPYGDFCHKYLEKTKVSGQTTLSKKLFSFQFCGITCSQKYMNVLLTPLNLNLGLWKPLHEIHNNVVQH